MTDVPTSAGYDAHSTPENAASRGSYEASAERESAPREASYEVVFCTPYCDQPCSPACRDRYRLGRVQAVLRGRAKSARAEAVAFGDPDSYSAAALRGKARGYHEAADLIESALRGGRIRRKWRLR